jgi:hypothetical protein
MPGTDSTAAAPTGSRPFPTPDDGGLVSFAVHSLPQAADAPKLSRTARGRIAMLAVLLVCALPVVASYLTYFWFRPEGRSNHGVLVQPPRALPATLSLASLEGRPVPAASLVGQWLLVVVADAACDTRCERHLWLQRQLHETLGREKDRVDKVWLVANADGAAATPPRPEVLRGIGPQATVLRTDRAALARWLEPESGQALDAHLYVVDPRGDWMMRFPPDVEPARLKRDLERLLRASSSWDRPGR